MKPIPEWVKTPTDFIVHLATIIEEQEAEINLLKSRIHDAIAWMDLKEWNCVDREILLEMFRGGESE